MNNPDLNYAELTCNEIPGLEIGMHPRDFEKIIYKHIKMQREKIRRAEGFLFKVFDMSERDELPHSFEQLARQYFEGKE